MPKHTGRKTLRRQKKVHKKRTQRTKKTARRLKGGNYAKDVTIKEVDGIPVTKNAIVTVPGRGTMSVQAFRQLKEDLDRNGDDYYD